jgi:PKD repeat protein
MMAVVAFMALNLTSCGTDPEPAPTPTIQILADNDNGQSYEVTFTVQTTDGTSLAWNYGDGEVSANAGNHTYTYTESGEYTVSVTVTGEGGTATATAPVSINASIEEMLAGVDAAGKSWIFSSAHAANDGAGPLAESAFNTTLPFAMVGDALAYVGIPDEYDNKFTFKPDGTFSIDPVNSDVLGTQIYVAMNQIEGATAGDYGFASIPYDVNTDASWAVDEAATISLDVRSEDPMNFDGYTEFTATYADVTRLTITDGHFGILDVTNYVIIENITASSMQVLIFLHTEDPDKPGIFTRLTYVPAS